MTKQDGRRLDRPMNTCKSQITIILDVDETLIHSIQNPLDRMADFHVGNYFVYKRPHLGEFISNLRTQFKLAIWSSGGKTYIDSILKEILPSDVELDFIWTRPDFATTDILSLCGHFGKKHIKRLTSSGYEPSRTLVIDDNPDDSIIEYGNVIQVEPFRGDPDDCELLLLSCYLRLMDSSGDIRQIAKSTWRDEVVKLL